MHISRVYYFLFTIIVFQILGQGQSPRIRTEYLKDEKMTKVETNFLYVANTPEQFVQVLVRSWFKGEKLTKPPGKVSLSIFSFSKQILYKNKDRKLIVVTDGEEWKVGTLEDVLLKGETKNGKDTFFSPNGSGVGLEISPPKSALIKTDNVNGLYLEWTNLDMKPEQFFKIANAKKVELKLGESKFEFGEGHLQSLRELADSITVK
jgi:hypothetical protein